MIKIDIDMPKNCEHCPLCNHYYHQCILSYEYMSQFGKVDPDFINRPENCPLIEVKEDEA